MDDGHAESRRPSATVAIVVELTSILLSATAFVIIPIANQGACTELGETSFPVVNQVQAPGVKENFTIPLDPDSRYDSEDANPDLWDKILAFFCDEKVLAPWGFLRLLIPAGVILPIVALFALWRSKKCSEE